MKYLSRRFFLGGAGAMVGLPLLEAMLPRRLAAQSQHKTVRLIFVWARNGLLRHNWLTNTPLLRPGNTGTNYTLTPALEALAPFRKDTLLLSGVSNHPGSSGYTYPDGKQVYDGAGDHARDSGCYLTCTRINKSETDIQNGISIDQVAAQTLKAFTPAFPALVLGFDQNYGGDSGYGPVYTNNISWTQYGPAPKKTNPQALFNELFAGFDAGATASELEKRKVYNKSLLDYALEDAQSLRVKLSQADQTRLDHYFTSIRELELALSSEVQATQNACMPVAPSFSSQDFLDKTEQFYEIIKLAFVCDRSRVVSFMLDKPGSSYDFLRVNNSPITDNHHSLSHQENWTYDLPRLEAINTWHVTSFVQLIARLQSVTDAFGETLLDNTLALLGGGLDGTGYLDSSGTRVNGVHNHTDLTFLLAGRGGGAINPGRHVDVQGEPLANLYISMLQAAGVPATTFGLEGNQPMSALV